MLYKSYWVDSANWKKSDKEIVQKFTTPITENWWVLNQNRE